MKIKNLAIGDKVRTTRELKSMIKDAPPVPKGTDGIIVYRGDHAITVDFQNTHLGKWSISHGIAEESFEPCPN